MSEILNCAKLSNWVNKYNDIKAPIPKSLLLKQDEKLLKLSERYNIFSQIGRQNKVVCQKCEYAHVENVIMQEGKLGYNCLLNGWVNLSEDDVILLSFNRAALLDMLTSVANLKKNIRTFYAGSCLVSLGLVSNDGQQPWSLGYADKLEKQNVMTSVTTALSDQFPDGPGLIVTPSFVHTNLPLPRKYKLVNLNEFVIGIKDSFVIDNQTVETLLSYRSKTPDKAGRPSQKEIARQIWKDTHSNPEWPKKRIEQAKFIAAQWDDSAPLPELGTLENHIRGFEKEEKSSR